MNYANPYVNPYINYQAQNFGNQYPQMQMQPQIQQMQPQPTQQPSQPQQDDRIWVTSEAAAEAYMVAPGGFVRLWDSNKPVFYEKWADMSGKPLPMNIVDYKSRSTQPAQEAKKDDTYDYLEKRIKRLEQLVIKQEEPTDE